MKKLVATLIITMIACILQGCEKKMEYSPEDFFSGEQLDVATLIYNGNEVKLKERLNSVKKEELNYPAKEKMTLLFWSILNSSGDNATPERLRIITDLVKAGADPLQPQPNASGSPAEFVLKGEKNVWIKAMLEGGLSANARDRVHNEPIIFESIKAKNPDTLNMMIKYGADINIKDSLGRTLLINSLFAGKVEHINCLLSHGANPNIKDNFNESFTYLLNKEIDAQSENSNYVQELIKVRDSI